MKKLLATICALMMMTGFVSCGDTQESSSEPSSSVSESATEEVTTEPVTEEPTEKEVVLDSEWENDYLKISICSEWSTEENENSIRWSWKDENSETIYIGLYVSEPIENESYGDYETDRFIKNGQEYIVLENKEIHFSNSVFSGTICPSIADENLVMEMIDSIEFRQNEDEDVATTSETTTTTAETTTEVTTTEKPTSPPTERPTPAPTNPPTQAPTEARTVKFILNTESGCVHKDSNCTAAKKISAENYAEIEIREDELADYANTYWACGKCSKAYSSKLPKF